MSAQPEASVYSDSFFDNQKAGSLSSAQVILSALFGVLGRVPVSVADFGCGVGTWLRVATELGAAAIRGFDGPWVPASQLTIPAASFTACDLAHVARTGILPAEDALPYDLVISVEVAEHLPPVYSADFVQLLCKCGDLILFSAAIPYQGGESHVNEDWPTSWSDLFAQHGFECFDALRSLVWANPAVEWWYAQNVLVFAKGSANAALRTRLEPVPQPLVLVHPRKYLLQVTAEQELREGLAAATAAPLEAIAPFTAEVGHLERKLASLRAQLEGEQRAQNSSTASELLEVTSLYDRVRHEAYLFAQEVKRLQSVANDLESRLALQGQRVQELSRELSDTRDEHARRIAEMQKRLNECSTTLTSVLNSTSWKVTAPIRALSEAARRGRENK